MDNRDGHFKEIGEDLFKQQMKKDLPMVFQEGEVLEVQQSRFRVTQIQEKRLKLQLLGKMGPVAFKNGETLTIRGSNFWVERFRRGTLTLKLQPQPENKGLAGFPNLSSL